MTKATEIAQKAVDLLGGDRAKTHGDKRENHLNIAALWNAYLGHRIDGYLSEKDVALMMALLKIARTKAGDHNPDDYVDLVGYGAIAGELATPPIIVGAGIGIPQPPGTVTRVG